MPFTVNCWRCGREYDAAEEPQLRPYCEECAKAARDEHRALITQYAQIKRKVMMETALRKMERGGVYMYEYIDIAKEIGEEFSKSDDKFLSADEIIAAMILKSYGVEYEANKRISGYIVDFYLPELYVCLEIDGEQHETKRIADSKRDIAIRAALGDKWEIVRIQTGYLEKNPEKLLDAIDAIYAEKKKLRAQNHGIIPEHFSRRERDHYKAAAEWKKVKAKQWGSGYY